MERDQKRSKAPRPQQRIGSIFLIPIVLLVIFIGATWYLSRDANLQVRKETIVGAELHTGVVLENVPSENPLGSNSYITAVIDASEIATIFYSDGWATCMNESVSDIAATLERGSRIEVFGLGLENGIIDASSRSGFYLKQDGKVPVTEGWQQVNDPDIPVSFKIPRAWSVASEHTDEEIRTIEVFDESRKTKMVLSIFPAPHVTPDDWLSRYYNEDQTNRRKVVLGDWDAVEVETLIDGKEKIIIAASRLGNILQVEFDNPKFLENQAERIFYSLILSSFSLETSSAILDSGIEGMALVGPVCPVQREGEECSDIPFEARLRVIRADGYTKRFASDGNGIFKVALPPGTYTFLNDSDAPFPSLAPFETTVRKSEYNKIRIIFDSGIR